MRQNLRTRLAPLLLAGYAAVLTLIAVWPVPVDADAAPAINAILRLFPWLTYDMIEFGANVALFVPLGILLAMIMRKRILIVPIALATTVIIESAQALLLAQRTSSVLDVIANTAGASIGLLLVVFAEKRLKDL